MKINSSVKILVFCAIGLCLSDLGASQPSRRSLEESYERQDAYKPRRSFGMSGSSLHRRRSSERARALNRRSSEGVCALRVSHIARRRTTGLYRALAPIGGLRGLQEVVGDLERDYYTTDTSRMDIEDLFNRVNNLLTLYQSDGFSHVLCALETFKGIERTLQHWTSRFSEWGRLRDYERFYMQPFNADEFRNRRHGTN